MIIFPSNPQDQDTYRVGYIIYVYSAAAKSWTASNGFTNTDFVSLNRIRTFNNTEAVSTITGALTVVGGAGIGGDIYAGNIYSNGLPVLTFATVTGTIATIVAGTGVSVSIVGSEAIVWSTATLQTVTDAGSSTNRVVHFDNLTTATNSLTGAVTVAGGVGVGANLWVYGQIYSEAGTLLYTPKVTVSPAPPPDPRPGDFWIDDAAGIEYQYIFDGVSYFWVQFVGV
jgi:hypothetical protein